MERRQFRQVAQLAFSMINRYACVNDDGKQFVVRADEKVTAFLDSKRLFEAASCESRRRTKAYRSLIDTSLAIAYSRS
jgi:hypothetical protein